MISFCDLDNIVHVKSEYVSINRPELIVHYWSTGINTHNFVDYYGPLDDQEIYQSSYYAGTGRYQFRKKGQYLRPWIEINLIELGRTNSTKTDIIPIPCPKVKSGIKTRWSTWHGRWEKELKHKGWVPA